MTSMGNWSPGSDPGTTHTSELVRDAAVRGRIQGLRPCVCVSSPDISVAALELWFC